MLTPEGRPADVIKEFVKSDSLLRGHARLSCAGRRAASGSPLP